MSRSSKKGPYIDERLLKKISNLKVGENVIIKTWSRAASVTPEMVGFTFGVHNGKSHISVLIHEDMVGHKLGEFALTRRFTKHGGKMQREQEKGAEGKESVPAKPGVKK